jgi:hypothetical protein
MLYSALDRLDIFVESFGTSLCRSSGSYKKNKSKGVTSEHGRRREKKGINSERFDEPELISTAVGK